jgi:quinoprotein glucose dehydrogenase
VPWRGATSSCTTIFGITTSRPQPSLATITLDGKERDVVIQGTKQGLVFVLDRDTGEPALPTTVRPLPQAGVPGEVLSPTQPFPADLPPLGPDLITPEQAWGLTPWDRGACAQAISSARSEGRFTPPSLQGTLVMPFTGGGVNWGGLAVDGGKGVVYVNSSSMVARGAVPNRHPAAGEHVSRAVIGLDLRVVGSRPVPGSSATTALNGVQATSLSPTRIGVTSNFERFSRSGARLLRSPVW